MPGDGSCIAIKEGRSEGSPVGGNGRGGNRFHQGEKTQQGYRKIGFAVILEVDSLYIGDFGRLPKWRVLRVSHPAVDQTDDGVVGLQQAGRIV
uniref:Uncharacterized protein n=1 Tax=Romanomermis culicivorax TaxID=13658 RepID=A0A915J0G3_ROMCU